MQARPEHELISLFQRLPRLLDRLGPDLTRSRSLLRRLLKEHAPDDARQELAEGVVRHLEESGFELDGEGRALRKRPPLEPHGMARGE